MAEQFIKLCKISELHENHGKRFIVDNSEIAVFKIGDEVFAINNICPHQHTALLYDGFVEDRCVVCPAHGWKFDLRTGKRQSGGRGVTSYPIKFENDDVFICVKRKELKW